jgi:hypothetical protein
LFLVSSAAVAVDDDVNVVYVVVDDDVIVVVVVVYNVAVVLDVAVLDIAVVVDATVVADTVDDSYRPGTCGLMIGTPSWDPV